MNWQCFKFHATALFYDHQQHWARLFLQAGSFSSLSSDKHYKMQKLIKDKIVTGMELIVNPDYNITIQTRYTDTERHVEIEQTYQDLANRRAQFRDASQPAGHVTRSRHAVRRRAVHLVLNSCTWTV